MKNKFNQINKEIILNYVVKNTSSRKKCKYLIIIYIIMYISYLIVLLMLVYKCCIVNCRSNYTGDESTTVFSFPKEEDLKIRWIRFVNRKDWGPLRRHIYVSNILKKNITKKVKPANVTV